MLNIANARLQPASPAAIAQESSSQFLGCYILLTARFHGFVGWVCPHDCQKLDKECQAMRPHDFTASHIKAFAIQGLVVIDFVTHQCAANPRGE